MMSLYLESQILVCFTGRIWGMNWGVYEGLGTDWERCVLLDTLFASKSVC